jgi:indole-3-glycerol phosphate synthase
MRERAYTPLEVIKRALAESPVTREFPFEKALSAPGLSFICEVKKASPSKGIISEDFPYLQIAQAYEKAGASAFSVLTEPRWFLGSATVLLDIAESASIPILRKDFTVDEYQIYEARAIGASAVLLICSILTDKQLSEYIMLADSLGLSALTEAHDEEEVSRAVSAGARIIGINNRDLATFDVDTGNSARLRALVPDNILFVSESGISDPDDIKGLSGIRPDAVLIGEAMMKAEDKSTFLKELKTAYEQG